jgi:menaquinone-dependent protoporphyrinogen oxidase
MQTRRILVLYATSYGQTRKIAQRLADVLTGAGCEVSLVNAREPVAAGVRPQDYDGVVVGGSIIARGLQPAVVQFVRTHRAVLDRLPSAFFQVSASAGSAKAEGRAAAQQILDRFLRSTGWHPDVATSMAGAINYTKYNLFLRWFMRRASRLEGGSTDTSRDHEYTDWTQVEDFARQFLGVLERARPGSPVG